MISKKIIITGVGGMIGSYLANYFLKKKYRVYGIDCKKYITESRIKNINKKNFYYFDCNLNKKNEVSKLIKILKKNTFKSIWHLAANSDIQKGTRNQNIEINNTFFTTVNSLLLAEKLKIRVFCFTSSSAIYGDKNVRFKENYGPLKPISKYGAMKAASESIIFSSIHNFDKIFIFRFPNVISKNVTHGLFYDLPRKIKKNNVIQILGNGSQKKPYMHVDTLIKIIYDLYVNTHLEISNIFNLGPDDKGIMVKDIVNKFVKFKKIKNKKFVYQKNKNGWQGDVAKYSFDVSKLKQIIKFKIPSSIQAVDKTIKEIKI